MSDAFHRVLVVLLAAAAGCSNGGSSNSVANTTVSQTGAIVADPARNRVYVADAGNRRLLAFDSASGAVVVNVALASTPDGVASDARGEHVFVTLPSLHQILTFDASTFVQTGEFTSADALHAIAWRDHLRVVVASDDGVRLVDLDAATEQTIIPATPGNALIVQDGRNRRVWTAFSLNGVVGVATIDPDASGDLPVGNFIDTSVDPPINLTLSYDELALFVGSSNNATIDVVDAGTLELTDTIDMPPALVAVAANVTSTRLYASPGDPSISDYPADTFTAGSEYVANHAILRLGAAVDTRAANLLVHLANATIQTLPLFEDQIVAEPVLVTGTVYSLTLNGPPNQPFFLFGSARPGFIYYGPATAQPRHFLDLDLTTFLILTHGTLDGGGSATFSGTVDPATVPEGTQYYLQAIVVDPVTHKLEEPTNPMRITIFDPTNP